MKQTSNKILIELVIAMLIVGGLIFAFNGKSKTSENANLNNGDTATNPLSALTNESSSKEEGGYIHGRPATQTKTYTSTRLGVSFNYPVYTDTEFIGKSRIDVKVIEQGNTITLVDSKEGTMLSKKLEVWPKPTNKTLVQAVTDKFLKGIPKKCFAYKRESSFSEFKNYETVRITVDSLKNDESFLVLDEKGILDGCPEYVYGDFFMDPMHPDKFAFLGIHFEDSLVESTSKPSWFDTIQFLD